jgi:hypothetical protein
VIHAQLVCAAIASGGTDCAIVVDADRASAWQDAYAGSVSIASETPFGATPPVVHELTAPPGPDGARWTDPHAFDAGDFLPCAKTTVIGSLLDGKGGVAWRGSIELPRGRCTHPRVRPRVTCERSEVFFQPPSYDGAHPDPIFDHGAVECTVSLARAPAVPLHVYARLDGTMRDDDLTNGGVELPADIATVRCGPGRVAVSITTVDGAPVWRGKAAIACGVLLRSTLDE